MPPLYEIIDYTTRETLFSGNFSAVLDAIKERWPNGQGDFCGVVYLGDRIVARVRLVEEKEKM